MNSNDMKTPHEAIRDWINQILETKGWNPARLAKEAKVSPSTISRALNDERFVLTTKTIEKIKRASNEVFSNLVESWLPYTADKETTKRYQTADEVQKQNVIQFIVDSEKDNNIRAYVNKGIELEGYGIYPEDVIFVDFSEFGSLPSKGHIFLVRIKSPETSQDNLVFRYYDPPYLMTKAFHAWHDSKPLPLDDEMVKIVGRMIGLIRDFSET